MKKADMKSEARFWIELKIANIKEALDVETSRDKMLDVGTIVRFATHCGLITDEEKKEYLMQADEAQIDREIELTNVA